MDAKIHTLRAVLSPGVVQETELTEVQARTLGQGDPFAFCPRDERVRGEPDGTLFYLDSAVPELPPAA